MGFLYLIPFYFPFASSASSEFRQDYARSLVSSYNPDDMSSASCITPFAMFAVAMSFSLLCVNSLECPYLYDSCDT